MALMRGGAVERERAHTPVSDAARGASVSGLSHGAKRGDVIASVADGVRRQPTQQRGMPTYRCRGRMHARVCRVDCCLCYAEDEESVVMSVMPAYASPPEKRYVQQDMSDARAAR